MGMMSRVKGAFLLLVFLAQWTDYSHAKCTVGETSSSCYEASTYSNSSSSTSFNGTSSSQNYSYQNGTYGYQYAYAYQTKSSHSYYTSSNSSYSYSRTSESEIASIPEESYLDEEDRAESSLPGLTIEESLPVYQESSYDVVYSPTTAPSSEPPEEHPVKFYPCGYPKPVDSTRSESILQAQYYDSSNEDCQRFKETSEPKMKPEETPREEPRKEEPKEMSEEDPKETPKEELKETPKEEPKETPKETPKEEPKETPKEDPKEAPKEEPKETPKEEPKETPKEEPKETPKEEPKEDPKETPKEEPKEAPKEAPKEELKETPKETPKEEPKETPKEDPKETPKEDPKETPKEEPRKTETRKEGPKPKPLSSLVEPVPAYVEENRSEPVSEYKSESKVEAMSKEPPSNSINNEAPVAMVIVPPPEPPTRFAIRDSAKTAKKVKSLIDSRNFTVLGDFIIESDDIYGLNMGLRFEEKDRDEEIQKTSMRNQDKDVVVLKAMCLAALDPDTKLKVIELMVLAATSPEGYHFTQFRGLVDAFLEIFYDDELLMKVITSDPIVYMRRRLLCVGCTPVNSYVCSHCWPHHICKAYYWCDAEESPSPAPIPDREKEINSSTTTSNDSKSGKERLGREQRKRRNGKKKHPK